MLSHVKSTKSHDILLKKHFKTGFEVIIYIRTLSGILKKVVFPFFCSGLASALY